MTPEPLLESRIHTRIESLMDEFIKHSSPSGPVAILKTLLDEMHEGVILAGEDGRFLYRNPAAQRMIGPIELDVPVEKWPETYGVYRLDGSALLAPEELPLARAIRGQSTDRFEIFLRNDHAPQGLFLSVRGKPLLDGGKVRGGLVFYEDVTLLKREEVRAQRMTDLVAFAPVAMIETSMDARVVSWNSCAEKVYGYRPEEIVGKSYTLLVPPLKLPLMQEQMKKLLAGGSVESHETIRIRKDGRMITTWCAASPLFGPDGKVRGFSLVTRDITDRVQPPLAEEMRDAILTVSTQKLVLGWNQAAGRMFGMSREEAVGMGFLSLFPEKAQAHIKGFVEVAKMGQARYDFRTQAVRKDGALLEVDLSISPAKDQAGLVTDLCVVIRDVTELKLAESRIIQWKSIVDASAEGVARDDLEGRIRYWNKGCEAIYGYSEAEVLGQPFSMLMPPGSTEDFSKVVSFIQEGFAHQYEGVRRHKDGRLIHVSATLSPSRDLEGRVTGAWIYIKDITEQVRMREVLKRREGWTTQAQKMETQARMAAGIAHDFNNLLTNIQSNGQLLLQSGLEGEAKECMESILTTVDRGAEMTRQLLLFGRKSQGEPKPLDLNPLVAEEGRLLQRMAHKLFKIEVDLGPAVPKVKIDAVEIRQVLLNLVSNARDAMPEGGTIALTTRTWESSGFGPDWQPLAPGLYAWLAVRDRGTGMDEETQKHIFEPYFTTKAEGKGTGLGLALVADIVVQRGGKIWLESQLGKGTTFHICFPAVEP